MTQRPRILIAQQQRLALNTNLHASIRLLRSDTAGLTQYLEEQAAENPHLRLIPPEAPALGDWLPRWSGAFTYGNRTPAAFEDAAAAPPSLVAHVLSAIARMKLSRRDQDIAMALVETMEPTGWIGSTTAAIAEKLNLPVGAVDGVLTRLQTIDPIGIFARNLAECLALQARDQGKLDPEMAIILQNLDSLAAGDMARLAKLCHCDEAGIVSRFRTIRTMNPKPGSDFAATTLGADPAYGREPDLLARPLKDGRWLVSLNRSALPSLMVDADAAPPDATDHPKDALGKAKSLRHMLNARNDTLLRIGRAIAARQIAALIEGRSALRPMTMAEVAEDVGLHVSTISRIVAGASMDSPYGTWWLRKMFSGARGSRPSTGGPAPLDAPVQIAAAALRHRLGQIIAAEDVARPYSDAALADALALETGVRLARRTLAQYREAEGIPPAHGRRRRQNKT